MKFSVRTFYLLLFLVIFIFQILFNIPNVKAQSLSASPGNIEIGPNHKIIVTFSGAPGNHYDAIGIYKVGEKKPYKSGYQWLTSKKSGTLTFIAPEEPGTFEFQMWENNWKRKLATSNKVTIAWGKVTLTQSIGTHYIGSNKKVKVTYGNAPGYYYDAVGLYKMGDKKPYRSWYHWLESKTSGILEINAPEEPGEYEFQLWANNWLIQLATSLKFTVKWGPVTMKVTVHTADAQGKRKLTIQYTGAPGYYYDAIGLYKAGSTQALSYAWLTTKTSGSVELVCPNETDSYEIQLWANNWSKMLAKTQSFIPKNGPPPPVAQEPDPSPPPKPDPPPSPPGPDKPFTLRAYPGEGKVYLEWTAPHNTANVIGYNLYRKTKTEAYKTPITDFPIKTLNHMDYNVDNGVYTCYYMKAVYKDKTESAASNEVCVTPNAPKPVINIPNNANTTQPNYTFTGKVDPGSTVTVNGTPVTVGADGTFTATVKLNPGKNTITVVVKTKAGDTVTSTHTVNLTTGKDGKITILLKIGSKHAYVNGQSVILDVLPFIDRGRTFVPFRFIGESLGAQVGYTTDTSGRVATVTYQLGSISITLFIGKKNATVNGRTVMMDVPPQIMQGRTVVPLRFVTENLGCKVDWDGEKMEILITYPA